MTVKSKNKRKYWRTVFLALVALAAFIYSMIAIFEIPSREVIAILLAAVLFVAAMMILAAAVVALRWMIKRYL